jgi:beta-fructofuranosidase
LFDDKGRCIFLARAQGGRNGFNGYLILPRVLTLGDDGYLRQQPVPEIEALRDQHEELRAAKVTAEKPLVLKTKGECLEIKVELEPKNAKACGLKLRCSDDGKQFVPIRYADSQLDVAGTKFPLSLKDGEPLKLRIFLDRIAMEVFVGDGRHVVTKSITPPETDLGVAVFSEGGEATAKAVDVWTMKPAPIVQNDGPPK